MLRLVMVMLSVVGPATAQAACAPSLQGAALRTCLVNELAQLAQFDGAVRTQILGLIDRVVTLEDKAVVLEDSVADLTTLVDGLTVRLDALEPVALTQVDLDGQGYVPGLAPFVVIDGDDLTLTATNLSLEAAGFLDLVGTAGTELDTSGSLVLGGALLQAQAFSIFNNDVVVGGQSMLTLQARVANLEASLP